MKAEKRIKSTMIAPCGMNCAICSGLLRDRNPCAGCTSSEYKPTYCKQCKITNCPYIKSGKLRFCGRCDDFPCARLKSLDKRYRTKYGMSMLENLDIIGEKGLREFTRREKKRWACKKCGGTICVHKWRCIDCGEPREGKLVT